MKNVVIAALILLGVGFGILRGVFVGPEVARNALETQGFSNIAITGNAWFVVGLRGCGQNDAARFDATATNPSGRTVQVYVCTGWPLKGATIRT